METSETATRTELTDALTRAGRTERPTLVSETGTQLEDLMCQVWTLEQAWRDEDRIDMAIRVAAAQRRI